MSRRIIEETSDSHARDARLPARMATRCCASPASRQGCQSVWPAPDTRRVSVSRPEARVTGTDTTAYRLGDIAPLRWWPLLHDSARQGPAVSLPHLPVRAVLNVSAGRGATLRRARGASGGRGVSARRHVSCGDNEATESSRCGWRPGRRDAPGAQYGGRRPCGGSAHERAAC